MGMSQRRSSLRKRTTVGKERKTVTVALPLFDDKASGEENLLRVLLDTGSDGDLFFPTKRLLKLFEKKKVPIQSLGERPMGSLLHESRQ